MKMKFNLRTPYRSLEGVHSTVDTLRGKAGKFFAFLGPGYLVSVGYMDPGNWATDLAAGSRFQFSLIWVLLLSNIMAVLLQYLSAKLGVVRGLDLAQASRETYPPAVNLVLYLLAEIAIAATDLAEVLGMAIGLKLLTGLPLLAGVSITILDTFLILAFQNLGMRKMEAFIIALIGIISISFLVNLVIAKPDLALLSTGFIPTLPDSYALYIAIGIVGATVMPHNLYLHSALVQTRKFDRSKEGVEKAVKYNLFDSAIALNFAFFVNGAILILAASTFFSHGFYRVEGIEEAHHLLEPLLGTTLSPILFAVALIAAGQSSTITSTLAGQVVMEGYLHLRVQPWVRRLMTRLIAIVPAFLTVYYFGSGSTTNLLILSQVILSLQLGFATIPLIHFVSDRKKMGEQAIGFWVRLASWTVALIIVLLNIKLVWDEIDHWLYISNRWWLQLPVIAIAVGSVGLLCYITLSPLFAKISREHRYSHTPHRDQTMAAEIPLAPKKYNRISIAVDFSNKDETAIRHAVMLGGADAEYHLIHIVESAGARLFGKEILDYESGWDRQKLVEYVEHLKKNGWTAHATVGYGSPKKTIPRLVEANGSHLLVMGAHGHKTIKDLIFGQTVDYVRHHLEIPILVV